MRYLKKFILVGFIASCLVLSFSLSASAAAIEGVVDDRGVVQFPMDYVSDSSKLYYGIIVKTSSDKYYFYSFGLPSDVAEGTVVTFSLQKNNSNGSNFLVPHVYKSGFVTSGNYRNYSSIPVHFFSNGNFYSSSFTIFDKSSNPLSTNTPRYYRDGLDTLGTIVDYQLIYYPNSNISFNNSNLTDVGGPFYYTALPITHEGFYYEFTDGITNFTGTDLDKLVTSEGTLEPVYDGSGNIVNYTINQTFDLGLNDSDVPGAWDPDNYPDKEAELLDDLPGIQDSDIDSINDNLSSDSLNSNAVQWWYGRFSDVTSNNKFRSVMLTMLSLSVIAFVINKRGVL